MILVHEEFSDDCEGIYMQNFAKIVMEMLLVCCRDFVFCWRVRKTCGPGPSSVRLTYGDSGSVDVLL